MRIADWVNQAFAKLKSNMLADEEDGAAALTQQK